MVNVPIFSLFSPLLRESLWQIAPKKFIINILVGSKHFAYVADKQNFLRLTLK